MREQRWGRIGLVLLLAVGCSTAPSVEEAPVTGVVFFQTQQLDVLTDFYRQRVGTELWMDQRDCRIFRHGQVLFGFCEREQTEICGVLTFVYPDRAGVDRMYGEFRLDALDPPKDTPRYPIYNFFARDPDGRLIEFQVFTSGADWSFASAD